MELGTDIIEIERIQKIIDNHPEMIKGFLTEEELIIYHNLIGQRQAEFLSGRFCAKEAYVKALGTGFRNGIRPTDIEILPNDMGVPTLMNGPIVEGVKISISHSKTVAMATCLIDSQSETIYETLKKKGISL